MEVILLLVSHGGLYSTSIYTHTTASYWERMYVHFTFSPPLLYILSSYTPYMHLSGSQLW